MELLYTNILPLATTETQTTISDYIHQQFLMCDQVNIAVGYTSKASLLELADMVEHGAVRHIVLTIGMYYIEGMPESAYHIAMDINRRWQEQGIGEIRLVRSFKYHGKLYCFSNNGNLTSAVIGSANLGAIKLDATNRRQYEIAAYTTDNAEMVDIYNHILALEADNCSANLADILDIQLVREVNTALTGVELVTQVPQSNVDFYQQCAAQVSFYLPLKVPKYEERHMDDGKHFTKSNINVCYAAPRSRRKSRDWYETQLTVAAEVYKMEGYPEKNKPFFVVTDDGYWFKAHTTSDHNKQFSAVGDELIMGRWLKGRLAAAGLITPVNDTQLDLERTGMITQEILDAYGCDRLLFKKTGQTAIDQDGAMLDIWMLSFESCDGE